MPKNQKEYWDQAAAEKKFTTPFQMEAFKQHVLKSHEILDVGCGYGRVLNELWQEGFKRVYGIDSSSQMIERGKSSYPFLDLGKAQMPFEFEDNRFDAVVLVAVLTCIVKEAEQSELIKEIQRVLKPGGVLYINDFLLNHDERNIKRYRLFEEMHDIYGVFELPEGAILRHHTKDYIFKLTQSFETMEFQTLVYTTMNKHKSNGFYYLGKMKSGL